MKIQTSTTSANGKADFITEEKNKQKKTELLWEYKCLDGGISFFDFDRYLMYIDFDVYFMMQLIETSKFSWHL